MSSQEYDDIKQEVARYTLQAFFFNPFTALNEGKSGCSLKDLQNHLITQGYPVASVMKHRLSIVVRVERARGVIETYGYSVEDIKEALRVTGVFSRMTNKVNLKSNVNKECATSNGIGN